VDLDSFKIFETFQRDSIIKDDTFCLVASAGLK
jgi:hypothetical protein